MAIPRTTAVLAALSSAVLAVGCDSAQDPPDVAPASTLAAPAAAVTWADGVCSASSTLHESVRQMTAAVPVASTGPTTTLDQARTEIGERVEAVRQSAAALGTAVAAVPAGADPELVAAQQELQTASQRAQQAVEQLGTAARQVTDAQSSAEIATALVALKPALTATATDVIGYLSTLQATRDSRQEAVHAAFGAAPACATVRATPSS